MFWICIYTSTYLCTEGTEYYISTTSNTGNNVPQDCQFAQPEYDHEYDSGKTILRNSIILNATLRHDVWIGYFLAFTEFEYHGCAIIPTSGIGYTVNNLVDCHYACNGNYFGLDCSAHELQCNCIDTIPAFLSRTSCTTAGGLVCGENGRKAIYKFSKGKTSGDQDQNNTSYLCKASPSNSNHSAWTKCGDSTKRRKMWCRSDESSSPFLTYATFASWNEANDYCADVFAIPSTAVGYNGKSFDQKAFTNKFRRWTLQQGNESISGGPMRFAYVSPNSQEIKFSANAMESKNFLCLVRMSTNQPRTPATSSSSTTKVVQTTGTTNTTRALSATNSQSTKSTTTAVAAGVSVTVAIAFSAVVIVLFLRNKKKLCFENTKMSTFENRDDDQHISLARVESKPTAYYQANAPALDYFDGDMYQEIDSNETYAGIDESREDNNDYDYTNKGFKDSRKEISDNIYNHLNSAGDEYDHVGKGQSNVNAMENNYDVTSGAVRK
ncbi:hypothetical protein DPMN_077332 [Dreissena polymorpha]|uniref:Uncharacterized protein n=2 Tax=Dreissena polymorpha TaxID=45954 RepID=A0A9D4BP88_DREPO|nr:hypothetical protein DPMN_077332 [Dreissena polymorpha]